MAAGWLAACARDPAPPQRPSPACEARPKFRDSDFAAHEVDFFDRLVTRDQILVDPLRRSLSHALAPLSKNGQRHYSFILDRQSAMDPERHFDVITVSVARAGMLVKTPSASPESSGVGAANGTFAHATLQTPDGAYDLRVSEGRLLPEAVELAPFDVRHAVLDLAHRYQKALNARRTGSCSEFDRAPGSPLLH